MENLLFILLGIIVLLLFLFSISIIHIRTIRDDINIRWYNLVDKLQYRQDLIPNLVETVRQFVPKEEVEKYKDLIQQIIEIRARAGRNTLAGAEKIIVEHDLSRHLSRIFNLSGNYPTLGKSTNFLELRKEFSDMKKEIEMKAKIYNEKVRDHNREIRKFYNFVPALLLNYKRKNIFEFE